MAKTVVSKPAMPKITAARATAAKATTAKATTAKAAPKTPKAAKKGKEVPVNAAEPKASPDAPVVEAVPAEGSVDAAKKDKPKKKSPKYALYVHRVLHVKTPGATISRSAVSGVAQILSAAAEHLARRTADMTDTVTITARDVMLAAGTILEGDLKTRAISKATAAVTQFNASKGPEKDAAHIAATTRSGLIIPPSLVRKVLQGVSKRVSLTAPVLAAGVIQEIAATLLAGAHTQATDSKAKRIKSRHVAQAVAADPALDSLVKGQLHVILPEAGILVTPKEAPREGKKEKRTRRGIKVARNIRQLQNTTDTQLQKLPFKRWVTALVKAVGGDDCRYAHDFFDVLQAYTESRAVELFQNAALMTSHSGRQVVQVKDIATVLTISRGTPTKALPEAATIVAQCSSQQHAMRRLSRRAGVTSISSPAIQQAQAHLCHHLAAVLNSVIMLATSQRKKVLTVDHLKAGLNLLGISLVV